MTKKSKTNLTTLSEFDQSASEEELRSTESKSAIEFANPQTPLATNKIFVYNQIDTNSYSSDEQTSPAKNYMNISRNELNHTSEPDDIEIENNDQINENPSENFNDNDQKPTSTLNTSGSSKSHNVRKWDLTDKLNVQTKYNSRFVKFLDAKEFDFKYVQNNGFEAPLVFTDKSGLGLRVPSENFKVSDVKSCVGSKRLVDVIDVNTQEALTMTMKDWCEYYENCTSNTTKPARLLNVISLEFSNTKLENYVEAPRVVRQLDWIETAWPEHLREPQIESSNQTDNRKYPKVQKYVLMSPKGCYTDFHIDMGGTSVWYHILKGEKVFWMIPPTLKNLKTYERWMQTGEQSNTFLPDLMDECERITLKQGWTFMLPSGWIHGVYTQKDSLVFGGNFLHSFNIPMQLKVHAIEQKLNVPFQYRYPYFIEMIWFVVERYAHCLTGITHFCSDDSEMTVAYQTFEPSTHLNALNKYELNGIKLLCEFLYNIKETKRNLHIPSQIVQPDLLLITLKKLLDDHFDTMKSIDINNNNIQGESNYQHSINNSDKSINIQQQTGTPFMHWPKPEKKYLKKMNKSPNCKRKEEQYLGEDVNFNAPNQLNSFGIPIDPHQQQQQLNSNLMQAFLLENLKQANLDMHFNDAHSTLSANGNLNGKSRKHVMRNLPRTKGSIKKRLRPQNVPRSNVERRRRVRCHRCEPCTRDDCGECKYCKDMKKFGGTGISKQCCLSKQCLQPLLPTTTTCMHCELLIDRNNQDKTNHMYECEICFEIYHVQCFRKQYSHLNQIEPIINEDLHNCWQCANCVNKGYMRLDNANNNNNNNNNSNNSNGNNNNNTSIAKTRPDEDSSSNKNNNSANNSLNNSFNSEYPSTSFSSVESKFKVIKSKKAKSDPLDCLAPSNQMDTSHENTIQTESNLSKVNEVNEESSKSNSLIEKNKKKESNKKLKMQVKLDSMNLLRNSDNSLITVDSLTPFQKEIILREFCVFYMEPTEIKCQSKSRLKHSQNKCTKNSTFNNSTNDTCEIKKQNSFDMISNEDDVLFYNEEDYNENDVNDDESEEIRSFESMSANNNSLSSATQLSSSNQTAAEEFIYDNDVDMTDGLHHPPYQHFPQINHHLYQPLYHHNQQQQLSHRNFQTYLNSHSSISNEQSNFRNPFNMK